MCLHHSTHNDAICRMSTNIGHQATPSRQLVINIVSKTTKNLIILKWNNTHQKLQEIIQLTPTPFLIPFIIVFAAVVRDPFPAWFSLALEVLLPAVNIVLKPDVYCVTFAFTVFNVKPRTLSIHVIGSLTCQITNDCSRNIIYVIGIYYTQLMFTLLDMYSAFHMFQPLFVHAETAPIFCTPVDVRIIFIFARALELI